MKGAPGAGAGGGEPDGEATVDPLRVLIRSRLAEIPEDGHNVVPTGVVDGLRGLTRLDGSELTDDELLRSVRTLESARRALDTAATTVVGELHARNSTDVADGLRTAPWLGWHLNLPRRECSARVAAGTFLRHHEEVREALAAGRISFEHAALLARLATPRVAEVVQALQAELVELAQGVRFGTWAREVRALLDLADADGGHDPGPDDTHLSLTEGLDGTVHVQAELVGQWAVEARAALEAEADRLFHAFRSDAAATGGEVAVPPRQALLAMAFVELCRAGRAAGHAERPGAGPTADVTLVVTAPSDLEDRWRHPQRDETDAGWLAGLLATTLDGMPVRPSVARLLACDPAFQVLVESHTGETLHLGRSRRHASPAQGRGPPLRRLLLPRLRRAAVVDRPAPRGALGGRRFHGSRAARPALSPPPRRGAPLGLVGPSGRAARVRHRHGGGTGAPVPGARPRPRPTEGVK